MTADSAMICLRGATTCLIVECAPGTPPLWRHWGPQLDPNTLAPLHQARATPSFSPDADRPFTLLPCFGTGWFAAPALLAHRAGRHFAHDFATTAIDRLADTGLRITLHDRLAALTVQITLALDPRTDVLTMATTLANDGDDILDLQWLAAGVLPLPGTAATVRAHVGRHLDEFHLLETKLNRFGWRRENRRGITSHDAFPGAIVTLPGTTQDAGLAYAAQLAWSGNHAAAIDWVDDGRYQWQLGEWLAPGEIRLAPGASYRSPDVLAICSTTGLNGIAQGFHAAIRRGLAWPGGHMRPRPVTMNTWEACYFDHDPARLCALADAAAAIGVERFVLDDGWFGGVSGGRDDDTSSLGDWRTDPRKYPDGLGPLIAHVTALGMEFGLWVEPEMANPDSDLLRAHPDWALQVAGRTPATARHQLVLDLARPAVADHLFAALAAMLSAHPIAYLKWDHNRDLADAAGPDGTPRYHAQVQASYALLDRLRAAFPRLEIEACAGGGGRTDAGILRRTHRIWTSDNSDARSRVAIQRGFLQFFPPEVMGAHVGTAPAHTTGRSQSLAFRAAVALPGHFGIEFDLAELDPAGRTALAGWVALHKQLRGILHGPGLWQGAGQDGLLWQAHGTPATGSLVLLLYRLDPPCFRHPPPLPLPLPMLDGTGPWHASCLRATDPHAPAPTIPATCDGTLLARLGLAVPQLRAEQALVILLQSATPAGAAA